jgi:uncharacterized protein YegL
MSEPRGQLLPVYVLADESGSMAPVMAELNAGLASLHRALLAAPMAAAKVRFTVIGFADEALERVHLADLRRVTQLPLLSCGGNTDYGTAFDALLRRIPYDVRELRDLGYAVFRPAVFFLSDGKPGDGDRWRVYHHRLTDRSQFREAPNIVACGIGAADAATILGVATRPEFSFVSIPGADVGAAIADFCAALTHSVIATGMSVVDGRAELVVDQPQGFRMAIDVI